MHSKVDPTWLYLQEEMLKFYWSDIWNHQTSLFFHFLSVLVKFFIFQVEMQVVDRIYENFFRLNFDLLFCFSRGNSFWANTDQFSMFFRQVSKWLVYQIYLNYHFLLFLHCQRFIKWDRIWVFSIQVQLD